MIKKLLISISFLMLVYGCNYEPIYSKKNKVNFFIENISFEGDREINNLINKKLDKYKKDKVGNNLSILVFSSYTKKSQSKNTSGTTTRYKLEADVKFEVSTQNSTSTINITKNFDMKNLSDKFEEKIYEDKIKDNLCDLIVNELILSLPRIE